MPEYDLLEESHIVTINSLEGFVLKYSAVRYMPPVAHNTTKNGVVLVALHGINARTYIGFGSVEVPPTDCDRLFLSTDKEHWLPTLRHLIQSPQLDIRDAWVLDAQNHGDSALLNEEVLATKPELTGDLIPPQIDTDDL